MEIKVLYVMEVEGKKKYFAKECDRSYAYNMMREGKAKGTVKRYEIILEE